MTGRSNNYIKRFFDIFKLIAAVFAVLIIASCPDPMTDELFAEVEDTEAPVITITTPGAVADDNLFINSITITGIVVDYSNESGTVDGQIQSFTYYDEDEELFEGTVSFGSDGSFTIFQAIANPNHPALFGGLTVVLLAVDWNGNSTPVPVRFYAFGDPIITSLTVNSIPAGNNDYSSNINGLKRTLLIEGNATSFANSIIYSVNHNSTVNNYNFADLNTHDPITGNFSISLDPAGLGWSGPLVVSITSETASGGTDTKTINIADDPTPPANNISGISNDNDLITLTFTDAVYHNGLTALVFEDFNIVYNNGGDATVTATILSTDFSVISGTEVQFNVAVGGFPDGTQTITISPSGTPNIPADWYGNPVTEIEVVTLRDKKGPKAVDVTSISTGAYNAGNTINVTVEFDENVDVNIGGGTPSIALNTIPGAVAEYSGGDGTNTLTFDYLVTAGENIATLDYVNAATSLTLNGGTFKDVDGNDAAPALPPLGLGSSLAQKNITIDTIKPAAPANMRGNPIDSTYYNGEYTKDRTPTWMWDAALDDATQYRYNYVNNDWASPEGTTTDTWFTPSSSLTNNTSHTLYVQAGDEAGNWSALSSSFMITIDNAGPVVTIPSISGSKAGPYTIPGVTATDAGSDVNTGLFSWTQDSGTGIVDFTNTSILDPEVSIRFYEDDTYTLQLEAFDNLGNSGTDTVDLVWDDGPVLTSIVFRPAGADPGSGDGDTITFYFDEAIDPSTIDGTLGVGGGGSDINDQSLADYLTALGSFPGDPFTTTTGDDSDMRYDNGPPRLKITLGTTTPADGTGTQPSVNFVAKSTIKGTDGKFIHDSGAVTPTGKWDETAPVTDSSPNPNFYSTPQAVTLTSSTDAAVIYYSINGSAPTTPYVVPFTLITALINTTYTVKFYAVDLYGNIETVQSETYVITP